MKVLVALITTESDEPKLVESFIRGYESAGGIWNGQMVISEYVNLNNDETVQGIVDNHYDIVLRNTYQYANNHAMNIYQNDGCLIVCCTGGNNYNMFLRRREYFGHMIPCGAGKNLDNTTAYAVEFFDIDPFAVYGITNVTQSGAEIIIETSGDGYGGLNNMYVWLEGINGFSNNPPDGGYIIYEQVSAHKFKITWSLGGGTYAGGANAEIHFSSYSHSYIGGKLAYIKDTVGCSWWEARYRARITASENGILHPVNGYGKINVEKAIQWSGMLPQNEYNIMGDVGRLTIVTSQRNIYDRGLELECMFDNMANVTVYELYFGNELIETFTNTLTPLTALPTAESYVFNTVKVPFGEKQSIRYRGYRKGLGYSEYSNAKTVNNVKFKRLLIEKEEEE